MYELNPCEPTKCISAERPSQRQILTEKQKYLTKQLEEVNAALNFLNENPKFETGLDILAKGLR